MTKSPVLLRITPVGAPCAPFAPGMVTVVGTFVPFPLYTVEVPVPLLATQSRPVGPKAMPHGFTRFGSIVVAMPWSATSAARVNWLSGVTMATTLRSLSLHAAKATASVAMVRDRPTLIERGSMFCVSWMRRPFPAARTAGRRADFAAQRETRSGATGGCGTSAPGRSIASSAVGENTARNVRAAESSTR